MKDKKTKARPAAEKPTSARARVNAAGPAVPSKKLSASGASSKGKRLAKTSALLPSTASTVKATGTLPSGKPVATPTPPVKAAGKSQAKITSSPAPQSEPKLAKEKLPIVTPKAVRPKPRKAAYKPSPPSKSPPIFPRSEKLLSIPPILLEGDLPPALPISGPGTRYALAPQAVTSRFPMSGGELPESYGTERMFLAARDPHWLYASWDIPIERQRENNSRSRDGHIMLRVFAEDEATPVVPEIHLHPESRNWFVNVPRAATPYRAELGYYDSDGQWLSISTSQSTFTPPDAPSRETVAEFATIPPEVTFQQVVEMVQEFASGNQPLLEAVVRANAAARSNEATAPANMKGEGKSSQALESTHRASASSEHQNGFQRESEKSRERDRAGTTRSQHHDRQEELQPIDKARRVRATPASAIPIRIEPGLPWNQEQTNVLTRLIHVDTQRRVWIGSLEITELIRRQFEEEISSIAAAELGRTERETQPGIPEVSVSSPVRIEAPRGRRFWFKVNAELILYGATEPDAKVTIADRPVKLRSDGTFSFRFSLPDGRYQLPAIALSADGDEGREARLEFSRSSDYRGHVEAHPQDAALRPPLPENVR